MDTLELTLSELRVQNCVHNSIISVQIGDDALTVQIPTLEPITLETDDLNQPINFTVKTDIGEV